MVTAKQLLDYLRARPSPPIPAGNVVYGLVEGVELPLLSVSGFRSVPTYDTNGPALYTVTASLKVIDKSQDTAESLLNGYLAWLEGVPLLAGDPLPGLRAVFVESTEIAQAELFVFEVTAAITLIVDALTPLPTPTQQSVGFWPQNFWPPGMWPDGFWPSQSA